MTVIVANNTPPPIRGLLKRWFIEPKPNVFVGTVNRRTREKTIEYLRRNAPGLGLLVISTENNSQGFSVQSFGETDRREVLLSGLNLIAEIWAETETNETIEDTNPC
jgi:CRISPR-associated protein Cas2